MFAPSGYVSISSLLTKTHTKLLEKTGNLHQLVIGTMSDAGLDEDYFAYRASLAREFSLAEVLERALHQALEGADIYACHPEGGTWRFDFPVLKNLNNYKHVARMSGSEEYFERDLDWPYYEGLVQSAVKAKRDPWSETFREMPHAGPNLFYNRDNYLVDLDGFRKLDHFIPYIYSPEINGYPFKLSQLEPFEGWALCVEGGADAYASLSDEVARNAAKVVVQAAWGEDLAAEIFSENPGADEEVSKSDGGQFAHSGKKTVKRETDAFRFLDEYLAEHGGQFTKAKLRETCPLEIGSRGFERVWSRLREKYPEISTPGRRMKS